MADVIDDVVGRDLLELVERHHGRVRHLSRTHDGTPKILSVAFGPSSRPSHLLEIRDMERPEDPLAREERLRDARDRAHEQRRKETQVAVNEALKEQKAELLGETEDGGPVRKPKPTRDGDRWSKAGVTRLLGDILEAGETLGADAGDVVTAKGKNEIFLRRADQVIKLNESMPRRKK